MMHDSMDGDGQEEAESHCKDVVRWRWKTIQMSLHSKELLVNVKLVYILELMSQDETATG